VLQSIDRCPPALRPLLWPSLLLVGGTAQLPGLEHRLTAELGRLAPAGCSVHAFTPAE
jgi:actin-related protein